MADNTNPFGDARAAQQFSRDFSRYMEDAMNSYFAGQQFQGMRNNLASQSAASDRSRSQNNSGGWNLDNGQRKNPYARKKDPLDQFEDAFAKEMLDALVGGDFKQNINKALTNFSKTMGFDISELPGKIGQQMAKDALSSRLGTRLTDAARNALIGEDGKGGALGRVGDILGDIGNSDLKNMFNQMVGDIFSSGAGAVGEAAGGVAEASTIAEGGLATLGASSEAAATGVIASEGVVAGAATAISTALPPILIALAAIAVAAEVAGPALEGLADVFRAIGASAFKDDEIRAKRRDAAEKRMVADINLMIEKPFDLLNEAAQKWYDAWDQNLNTIAQTQGYDKESVYNLYSSYAERLREENLGSVISSTSIIDGLKQVLATGMSGKVAEEFAYVATKLQAAIPNMDFFQYASSYAQVASNAIAQGASQAEALNLANQQLEAFANNVLYANRELAGGFNTGLSNTSQLFADAVKIAQTARTGDTTEISGVLSSVSAVVGAVAPDLATGLVDNIVKAAIGGNSESIVALRSLAGINASNTEFLRAFANDPQLVFKNLFKKLSDLQTMSNDNFMEVAEGLAPIFGVDMAALAQVDFDYLSRAIEQMNVNSNSLEENIALLASGQSTTTAEQEKMAEINEMILNDGLAVILDNEVARTMQEHLWDEQKTNAITNAITTATYAIDIQGAGLHLLEGIAETISTILRFMHPLDALAQMIENIGETLDNTVQQREALQELLVKGSIKFNADALSALTDYSGSNRIDIFGEGINDSNAAYLDATRLNRMLFGGTDVEATGRYTSMINDMQNAADNLADVQNDLYGNTLGDLANIGEAIWSAGYGLSGAVLNGFYNPEEDITTNADNMSDWIYDAMTTSITNSFENYSRNNSDDILSQYSWGTVGKSSAKFLSISQENAKYTEAVGEALSDETLANKNKLKDMIESINDLNQATADLDIKDETGKLKTNVKDIITKSNTKSYDEWISEQFGDKDTYLEAIESYGTSEAVVKGRFEATQARASAVAEEARADATFAFNQDARNAIDEMRKYWGYTTSAKGVYMDNVWQPYMTFWGSTGSSTYKGLYWEPFYADGMKFDQAILKLFNEMVNERDNWIGAPTTEGTVRGLLHTINETLIAFNDSFNTWVQEWTDFYINHTTYTERTSSADWDELLHMEQATRDDTSLAIANALEAISNIEDLKDPTVQQNVLLAKIVVLLEAIMQQNNSTGGLALPDSLSALGLGLVNRT